MVEFVVLADCPEAASFETALLEGDQVQVVRHASGRPWLVGRWTADELLWAEAGPVRVAVIGAAPPGPEPLLRAAGRARTPRDLDALARSLPGSFHLVASLGGRVRAQGTVSAVRQIFHTRVGGVTVAANRARPLVRLSGAEMDSGALTLRLMGSPPPWPLTERTLWQGVERLAHDHYLELSPTGSHQEVPWWTPPEPDVPLAAGKDAIREALAEAVGVRTHGGGTVSADLSGGMDSTSVCFLADQGSSRLLTTRWEGRDPSNDDGKWASLAAESLPDAHHHVFPHNLIPKCFSDLVSPTEDVEAPFELIRTRAQLIHHATTVSALGSTLHLSGDGGDELFYALPIYQHSLARARPVTAFRQLRTHRAMYRWRRLPLLGALRDNRSFTQWLGAAADSLTAPPTRPTDPDFGWSSGMRVPGWVTEEGVRSIRRMVRQAAANTPAPLAPLRGQHFALEAARNCGSAMRQANDLTARFGLPLHAPYLDDRVIEAALSIRFADRGDPGGYKPALAAAMRDVVPQEVLGRPTKAEFSAEVYDGLRSNRSELSAFCEDMRLADLGLVDQDAFRSALLGLHPVPRTLIPLESTLAGEAWLRSVHSADSATAPAEGAR
ncbi:asparagine synthase-related protein [Streptomyces albidoflavus]|uniref:asparagine synthase-related protein n=1 Tax=Streptomyces albidoflavus TaxID=1886 RepID=UPI0033B5F8CB